MRTLIAFELVLVAVLASVLGGNAAAEVESLDPRGRIHIPIGIPNTLDTLKTFVEMEGSFSPGFGSYGIYFWVFDPDAGKLTAPTMEMQGVECGHGLRGVGYLIPWTAWRAGEVSVGTEVCEVRRASPAGGVFVVGARAHLTNLSDRNRKVLFYVALRPLGPAGWAVENLSVSEDGDALLVDGRAAIVSNEKPSEVRVVETDTIGSFAVSGKMPSARIASSNTADCSGAFRFDLTIAPGKTRTLGFVCPVLPGRRAVRHHWDGKSTWAQLDEARPNPTDSGALQPDPGLRYYRKLKADSLFDEAVAYWKDFVGRARVKVPDARWGECFAAIVGHVGMCMNEGAPDVSVVNYNVFNRDGVYTANILQKSGHFELAAEAIDYFLANPFSGRVYPEADNPGQILWIMGEQWLFTRDEQWLKRVYPSVRKLAAMIEYYRTTRAAHWVSCTSLEFGEALPAEKRQELKPGCCDGYHPEYTEAFDTAGLRKAAILAEAIGSTDPAHWLKLANELFTKYDEKFGARLAREYGSYSVLWPCRLYLLASGKGHEQFKDIAAQKPGGWRYFPLATAHQGLLAGNREAGYGTVMTHLDHEQMRGWYAFDEGGKSGPGGWRHVRTKWNPDVAMPHGWAIAELWLLLRDCLLYEDGDRLVLLSGVPPEWFTHPEGIEIKSLPTHFGLWSFRYVPGDDGATLTISGTAVPAKGFVLRLPPSLKLNLTVNGKPLARSADGDFVLPAGTKRAQLEFINERRTGGQRR